VRDVVPGDRGAPTTIERVALDDVPDLVASGRLIDAKSIIGLMLAREALR